MGSLMTTLVKANPLRQKPQAVATGLGWFSIGLGLTELLMPGRVERRTGLASGRTMTRLIGLREVATGIGLVTASDRRPWLAARVAGDALDIATLLRRRRPGALGGTVLGLTAVLSVMALDAAASAAIKNKAQHDAAAAWDYSDRVGIRVGIRVGTHMK